jgi:cytokinin riboside 5'-monophosphate phosphoribohydrolase
VFCASAAGLPEVYHQAARAFGRELARRDHRLVYGGGNVGLMGEVARAVHEHGGLVFGAIPRALVERELAYGPADELVVTDTLRQRKAEMDARADAFVALPGGFGTLEELLEVLTLRQLHLHDRPIVLLDANGYYHPFLAMIDAMVEQGFAPAGQGELFEVATTAEEALDLVEASARAAAAWGRRLGDPPAEALAEDWTAELPASQ